MSLQETIEADLLVALKAGDEFTRENLRLLKSVIKNAEIAAGRPLTDAEIVGIIQKEVKKRGEAEQLYQQAHKGDLAKQEAREAEQLQRYLPTQLGETEIQAVIDDYLAHNPTDIAQIGQAMGALSARLKGQADLGLVSQLLRATLEK